MANLVSFEALNTCVTAAEQQLVTNGQWDAAVAQAGSPDAVRHALVDGCLKQLGSTVTADQLTACSMAKLTDLQKDPAAYQQAISDAGGEAFLQAAIIATCLESLQLGVPVVTPPAAAEKKSSAWPWVLAAAGAVVLVGGVVAYAGDGKKKGKKGKKNPTHRRY